MGGPTTKIRFYFRRAWICSGDLETGKQDPVAERSDAAIPDANNERCVAMRVRLWARLSSAWLQCRDARVAHSVRALDHSGVLADFERAARGCSDHSGTHRWSIRDTGRSAWVSQGCHQTIAAGVARNPELMIKRASGVQVASPIRRAGPKVVPLSPRFANHG
jgi:hypothetical protein